MAPVETSTRWVPTTAPALQVALAQALALDPVLDPVSPALDLASVPALDLALDLALNPVARMALEVLAALVALLPSTRTNCTNSELRLWPIRCWPGDSPCQTTSRWLSKGRGPCLGCSSSSPCQAWLLELEAGQEVDQQDQDQDQWAQATAELTE